MEERITKRAVTLEIDSNVSNEILSKFNVWNTIVNLAMERVDQIVEETGIELPQGARMTVRQASAMTMDPIRRQGETKEETAVPEPDPALEDAADHEGR